MQLFRRWLPTGLPSLAALIAVSLFASTASAITVKYSTSFDFDPGAGVSNSVDVPDLVSNNVIGTFTLNGSGNQQVNTPELAAFFGSISFTSTASNGDFGSIVVPFEMTITETQPGGGGTSTNTFSGQVNFTGGLATILFNGGPITIGTVTYTPYPTSATFAPDGSVLVGSNLILGSVTSTAIPLPAAAWGGMALFGVLGGAKLRRSRQSALA